MALSNDQRADAANAQIAQFEAERLGHELNLARLSGVDVDNRDDSWRGAVEQALLSVDSINTAIEFTRAAAAAAKAGDPVVDLDAMRTALSESQQAAE